MRPARPTSCRPSASHGRARWCIYVESLLRRASRVQLYVLLLTLTARRRAQDLAPRFCSHSCVHRCMLTSNATAPQLYTVQHALKGKAIFVLFTWPLRKRKSRSRSRSRSEFHLSTIQCSLPASKSGLVHLPQSCGKGPYRHPSSAAAPARHLCAPPPHTTTTNNN